MNQPLFWMVLAASVAVFWLIPSKFRLGWLALVSFGYFLLKPYPVDQTSRIEMIDPKLAICLVAGWSILFFYLAPLAARTLDRPRRWIVPALILTATGYLAIFKYLPIVLLRVTGEDYWARLIIPLGISYLTFKLIHYVIEIGRGNIKDRSLDNFLCYIFLFPIFTAGPIERYDHFLRQRQERFSLDLFVEGVMRIAVGLVKMYVLSQMLMVMLFGQYSMEKLLYEPTFAQQSTWDWWKWMIYAYLQMYLNFSAYCDMAIGGCRLFGLRIMENFHWPIFATNITEFWKRWHMTLANWCMTYIYMPVLGLRRNPYLAAYATFIVMGLWHAGALTWVIWGAYHATGLIIYQMWGRYRKRRKWKFFNRRLWKVCCVPITFAFITGSFAFTEVHGHGGAYDSVRIFAKMFFINLPAR